MSDGNNASTLTVVSVAGSVAGGSGRGGWAWITQDGPCVAGQSEHDTATGMMLAAGADALAYYSTGPVVIRTSNKWLVGALNGLTSERPWKIRRHSEQWRLIGELCGSRMVTAVVATDDDADRWDALDLAREARDTSLDVIADMRCLDD